MYFDTINGYIDRFCGCINLEGIKRVFEAVQGNTYEFLQFHKFDLQIGHLSYSQYLTKKKENSMFEHHRKFCDIHIILDGEEIFYYYPINDIRLFTYNDRNDVSVFEGDRENANCVRLFRGVAVFVSPWDAHMPGISLPHQGRGFVKKLVVKIPWTQFCK